MRRFVVIVSLLAAVLPAVAHAQPWAGIVSTSRAMDWRTAGVEGGIPSSRTQCGATITAYSGAATTITNALAACGSGKYVLLGPGTFTLTGGILFDDEGVSLRGSGADSTKIVFKGDVGGCHIGMNAGIKICGAASNIGLDSPDHTATWTAGYSQGTTVITLSNTTGLAAGGTIYLDQLDDASDGYPAAGDLYVCSTGANGCSSQGGGDQFARDGRAQTTVHKVSSISGSNVIIDPPIYLPNFRSSRTPGAWWGNASSVTWSVAASRT